MGYTVTNIKKQLTIVAFIALALLVSVGAAADTSVTTVTVTGGAPNVIQDHYRWRNDDGSETTATWGAAEDTASTTIRAHKNLRLRFQVDNSGAGPATNYNYRLEYALQGADSDCDTAFTSETYTAVPDVPTTEHFDMVLSPNFADGDPTTAQLTGGGLTFVAGDMVESTSNQTGNVTLASADPDEYTEVEFVFKANFNASFGSNYCFRVTNAGTALDQYDIVASTTLQTAVFNISNLSLNGNSNIALTENTFKRATSSMLIEHDEGCDQITSVNATAYLASTTNSGTTCTYDGNSCYTANSCVATTTGNTCGAQDISVEYDCGFEFWYIAEPTDSGAPFVNDIWSVSATSSTGTATTTATNTAETIEVNSLFALDVTASIAYGTLGSGSNTGTTDQTATSTNTGNRAQDNQIGGDNMCITAYDPACTAPDIAESQQKFATTTGVDYSSKFNTLAASATPATIELDLPKPTATTSAVEDPTFWGIAIPPAQTNGSYAGENTFTAVAD